MSRLRTSILETVSYFGVFDCPLTLSEIRTYLDQEIDLLSLEQELSLLVELGILQLAQGFYSSDSRLIITRQQRFAYARRKLKKAQLVAKLFARLPWVRLVALGNQIGANNLRESGDLDLLIVCKPKCIWLTRLATAGLMAIARQRPTAIKSRDQICLSFFISSDNLSFDKYLLAPEDRYFTYWFAGLKVLYDADHYHQSLIEANAKLCASLPNWSANSQRQIVKDNRDKAWPWLNIFNSLESWARTWQLAHLPTELRAAQTSGQVIINDQVLKLHTKDRRRDFAKIFEERLQVLVDKL